MDKLFDTDKIEARLREAKTIDDLTGVDAFPERRYVKEISYTVMAWVLACPE